MLRAADGVCVVYTKAMWKKNLNSEKSAVRMKSALSISHRDVGCAERSEKDRLLVSTCAGDYFMLSWLKVSLSSGLSQDNVLRC